MTDKIIFQMTYFATCTNFINFQEPFTAELAEEAVSSPLVPQEISSILHKEYMLRMLRYVGP